MGPTPVDVAQGVRWGPPCWVMAIGEERDPLLGLGDVDSVRVLLRLADPGARTRAVATLRSWRGMPLQDDAAESVLRAAGAGYPWVPGVEADVGELLVMLLWSRPDQVPVQLVERCYVLCAERGRRALIRLLALRADREAVEAVAGLLCLDGPWDLLPVPGGDLLTPLLEAEGVERLTEALVLVAWRSGWAPHAADLLGEMVRRSLLTESEAVSVVAGLAPLVDGLVQACDRVAPLCRAEQGRTRVERRSLDALLPLLGALPTGEAVPVLLRALSSADPRVSARAALALLGRGVAVAEERLVITAKDPEARAVLADGLASIGRHFALPRSLSDERAVAEAELVAWLASETQLGFAPDELEHRGTAGAAAPWGSGTLHLFAFRVRPPHWSAERGWMLAAVGPYRPEALFQPRRAPGFAACSLYRAEDDGSVESHLGALAEAVAGDRDDVWD